VTDLVKLLLSKTDKGRDLNRSLVLLAVIYCAFELRDVTRRLERVESRIAAVAVGGDYHRAQFAATAAAGTNNLSRP
jgi:hypothetical protein